MGLLPENPKKTIFSQVLGEICVRLVAEGWRTNQGAVAVALGLGPPRLSRILSNRIPVGARTVAIVCSNLDRASAASLMQAYLTDEIDKVREVQRELGVTAEWGEDDLVRIVRVEI
jgi:hypothetical protein